MNCLLASHFLSLAVLILPTLKYKGLLLFFVCYCLLIFDAYAIMLQTDTLREIEIKARTIPGSKHSLNPTQKISGTALENTNSLTVADAVRHFAGVQLKDYGGVGGLKTINVRNLGSLHTAVFYDGIQLGNAQNGQVDLGRFSIDNVETIELYNGQSNEQLLPARAYSLSSSLYLQSRKPVFDRGRDKYKYSFKTGSFGLLNPSISWNHKLNSQTYSSISAEYQRSHGRYKYFYPATNTDTSFIRDNGNLNAFRLETSIYRHSSDSSEWKFQLYGYTSNRGLPSFVVRNNHSSKQQLWDNDLFVQGSYTSQQRRVLRFSVKSKYSYSQSRYLDPEFNVNQKLENRYRQNEYYLSFASAYAISSAVRIALSSDLIRNWMEAEIDAGMSEFPEPLRYTSLTALSSTLQLANFNFEATVLNTTVTESVKVGVSATDKSVFTPSLSASWRPFRDTDLNLRAFYKNSFRLPTFNDQYYTLIGNANLKPEYAEQYDLGFKYSRAFSRRLRYLSLYSDVYYNRVKDKIVALPARSLFLWTMMNVGEVEIKGFETGLASEFSLGYNAFLSGRINYTFQNSKDATRGGANFGEFIPYAPEHAGSATIGLNLNRYTLGYNFLYTGERYGDRPNNKVSYLQPWYTHDISTGYELRLSKVSYKLLAEMNNLFNQSYEVVRNYPMPGRSFRITLTAKY